jgi:hypothetical protein
VTISFAFFGIKPQEIREFKFRKIERFDIILPLIMFCGTLTLIAGLLKIFFQENFQLKYVALLLPIVCVYTITDIFFSKEKKFPVINNPYKRLYAPFLFDFLMTLTMGVSGLISFKYWNDSSINIIYLLFISLIFGFFISLIINPMIQFLSVRIVQVIEKSTPFGLVKFLNTVSKTGLMEKEGGQWRFRHKLIQDEFYHKYNGNSS